MLEPQGRRCVARAFEAGLSFKIATWLASYKLEPKIAEKWPPKFGQKRSFCLGEGEVGGVKSTGVSQSVRETSRDESKTFSPPKKTLQNKRFGAPNFLGISPKLFAALRGIHPYLCTPVLPRGQLSQRSEHSHFEIRSCAGRTDLKKKAKIA